MRCFTLSIVVFLACMTHVRAQAVVWKRGGDDNATTSARFIGSSTRIVTTGGGTRIWQGISGLLDTVLFPQEYSYCADVSLDGSLIAIGTDIVSLWDGDDNRFLFEVGDRGVPIRSVSLAPDARMLVAGTGPGFDIWSMETQSRITRVVDVGPITCVEFAPDGDLIAVLSESDTLRLWSVRRASFIDGFQKAVWNRGSVAFSPDGTMLAVSSGLTDGITVWEVPEGNVIRRVELSQKVSGIFLDHIGGIAFTPDSESLAFVANRRAIVEMNVRDGSRWSLRQLGRSINTRRDFEYSHDGRWILISSQFGGVIGYDCIRDSVTELMDFPILGPRATAFSGDGKLVAFSSEGPVRAFDVSTGKRMKSWQAPSGSGWNFTIDWARLSGYMAAGGTGLRGGMVILWSTNPEEQVQYRILDSGLFGDSRVVFTSDESLLVWATYLSINVWDIERELLIWKMPVLSRPLRIASSNEGRRVAVGAVDGTITIIDADDGSLREVTRIGSPVTGLTWSASDGQIAVAGSDGIITLVEADGHSQRQERLSEGVVWDLDMLADGSLVAGMTDGSIVILDTASLSVKSVNREYLGRLNSIAVDPTRRFIASAMADAGILYKYDGSTGSAQRLYDSERAGGICVDASLRYAEGSMYIQFNLLQPSTVRIEVFDALGKRLSTSTYEYFGIGTHLVSVDAVWEVRGRAFCRLIVESDETSQVVHMF